MLRPLHMGRSSSQPGRLHALVAPVQALHLHLLEHQLRPKSTVELEATLRPLLFPRERWDDTSSWRHNLVLVSWLRSLWMRALPSTRRILPAAAAALKPPHLPSMAETRAAFELDEPDGRSPPMAIERYRERQARERPPRRSGGAATAGVLFPELLEDAGAMIAGRGPLSTYCEDHGIYQLVTREMVAALADYIVGRRPCLVQGDETLRVLEVGAGNGELSFHLRSALAEREDAGSWELTASDNGSWGLSSSRYHYSSAFGAEVLPLSYRAALRQVRPHLVLTSWMPMGVDWSASFREYGVHEYVLLGEAYDGACGHNWATWGNPDFQDDEATPDDQRPVARAPYEIDGFSTHEIREVSRWMLSRFDGRGEDAYSTCAVSFRRGTV